MDWDRFGQECLDSWEGMLIFVLRCARLPSRCLDCRTNAHLLACRDQNAELELEISIAVLWSWSHIRLQLEFWPVRDKNNMFRNDLGVQLYP